MNINTSLEEYPKEMQNDFKYILKSFYEDVCLKHKYYREQISIDKRTQFNLYIYNLLLKDVFINIKTSFNSKTHLIDINNKIENLIKTIKEDKRSYEINGKINIITQESTIDDLVDCLWYIYTVYTQPNFKDSRMINEILVIKFDMFLSVFFRFYMLKLQQLLVPFNSNTLKKLLIARRSAIKLKDLKPLPKPLSQNISFNGKTIHFNKLSKRVNTIFNKFLQEFYIYICKYDTYKIGILDMRTEFNYYIYQIFYDYLMLNESENANFQTYKNLEENDLFLNKEENKYIINGKTKYINIDSMIDDLVDCLWYIYNEYKKYILVTKLKTIKFNLFKSVF